ncbi:MAG: hypothetical protein LBT98_04165, partial [Puniceicoccales bacterium]|nr:hypothetical protein [Puniceicoccales bacterium]
MSVSKILISSSIAPKVVMAFSALATALALAGAVTTAVLIFSAGLLVLWPALIGCAGVTAIGLVAFIICFCVSAKNGASTGDSSTAGQKKEDLSPLNRSSSSQIPVDELENTPSSLETETVLNSDGKTQNPRLRATIPTATTALAVDQRRNREKSSPTFSF